MVNYLLCLAPKSVTDWWEQARLWSPAFCSPSHLPCPPLVTQPCHLGEKCQTWALLAGNASREAGPMEGAFGGGLGADVFWSTSTEWKKLIFSTASGYNQPAGGQQLASLFSSWGLQNTRSWNPKTPSTEGEGRKKIFEKMIVKAQKGLFSYVPIIYYLQQHPTCTSLFAGSPCCVEPITRLTDQYANSEKRNYYRVPSAIPPLHKNRGKHRKCQFSGLLEETLRTKRTTA